MSNSTRSLTTTRTTGSVGGLFGSGLVRLLGIGISLCVVVLLARVLGPTEYGVYAYIIAFVSFLAMPLQAGLQTLVVRETARAETNSHWSMVRGFWQWCSGVIAVVTLVVVGLAVAIQHVVPEEYRVLHSAALWWGIALAPLMSWGTIKGAALTGLHRVVLGQLPDNVLRPGMLLALLGAWYFFVPESRLSVDRVMILTVAAALVSVLVMTVLLDRNRPSETVSVKPSYEPKNWFKSLWPLSLAAGLQVINSHADILILGIFVEPQQVGIFRAVTHLAGLVILALLVVNTVVAPRFARLYSEDSMKELQRLVTRSARIALIGAIPGAMVMILFGGATLTIVFGESYTEGWLPLCILATGQLVNAGMGSVGLLLNMTGNERVTAKGVGVAALLNVLCNFTLIPILGTAGAAIATSLSVLVWNIILWHAVRTSLGLGSTAFTLSARANPL